MGCGSPLGDLFCLADALLYRTQVSALPPAVIAPAGKDPSTSSGQALSGQLYNMYGEGQITEQVFTALRALADRSLLRPADLAVHRVYARRRGTGERDDDEVSNALRGIRYRLTQLAEARTASTKVLADLEACQADLGRRMKEKEDLARESVETNEDAARAHLTEKSELARSRDRLTMQSEALRADLGRLDDLFVQLEAKASELEAVQARSRLAMEVSQ